MAEKNKKVVSLAAHKRSVRQRVAAIQQPTQETAEDRQAIQQLIEHGVANAMAHRPPVFDGGSAGRAHWPILK